ncbi:ParB/RepB/Spo0J family partition protein [Microbacterium sp. KNMS]
MNTTPGALQLITVDPAELGVRDQVRGDATPDDAMIASVQAHGILQPPIVAWDDEQGKYVILFGHRRVGAAIAAGLTEIPVVVREGEAAAAVDAELLEGQIVENVHRADLHAADLARGWADLEGLFGKTPEEIAAATAEPVERVRAGIRVARSKSASAVVAESPVIDFEKAAIIAEFEDHPELQQDLVRAAEKRPENFNLEVERVRARIALAEAKADLLATVPDVPRAPLDQYGYLAHSADPRAINTLYDDNGQPFTPETHASCEGHAAYVYGWNPEDLELRFVCLGWSGRGHSVTPSAGALDPEEQERREALEREREEERKAAQERAARVEANRTARRQWIHDMLPGKINQLSGVQDYLAHMLLSVAHNGYGYGIAWDIVAQLLDLSETIDPDYAGQDVADILDERQVAPFRMLLASALSVGEDALATNYAADVIALSARVRHLKALEKWGYALTDVDKEALTADEKRLAEARELAAAEAAAEAEEADEDDTDAEDDAE